MISSLSSEPNPFLQRILNLARGVSILYVEDEPEIRQEMTEILTSLFPEVVAAKNGREGLDLLHSREFLLVITDINMPEMNGIEMISEIRTFRPHQSVLVTSAYSDANNLIPLLNLGVGSFLLKPLNWEQLLPTLYKELSLAQSAQQEARYQQRLTREVELRTRELQEAQQQVIKLGEAKDNMLALISHEMRTPLNAILGFLDLVRPALANDPEALTYLQYIDQASRRLDRSTKKALEFSQFSTGKRSIHLSDLHLLDLAQRVWGEVLKALHHEANPKLVCHGLENQLVYSDADLVMEALRNLFENSVKYGGADALVEVHLESRSVWIELTVRDHGTGFSEQSLAQLFTPFSTGNIMHHSEGMGLGLALVDVIMLTLGGKAAGGNHPQGGAWITLSFPLHRMAAAKPSASPLEPPQKVP
jgi:signal transduction histidine kinase